MLKTTAENKTDGLQQENPFFFSCSLSLSLISDAPGMLLTREFVSAFVMEGCLHVNGLFSGGYGSFFLSEGEMKSKTCVDWNDFVWGFIVCHHPVCSEAFSSGWVWKWNQGDERYNAFCKNQALFILREPAPLAAVFCEFLELWCSLLRVLIHSFCVWRVHLLCCFVARYYFWAG